MNTVGVQRAGAATGPAPASVMWRDVTNDLPFWRREIYLPATSRWYGLEVPAGIREWMDDHRGRWLRSADRSLHAWSVSTR